MRRNVLITACGAKVALVNAFRSALREGGRVIAADLSAEAAAFLAADVALRLPPWSDPAWGETVTAVCRRYAVALLVPTADAELAWLAPLADRLRAEGTTVLLPSPETVAICRDKRRFAGFCLRHGFPVPETFPPGALPDRYPVFARPARGQGGLGCGRVDAEPLLKALLAGQGDLVVQEYLEAPEYSVDLLMDLEGGEAFQAVARRRVAVRGGEACVSRVEDLPALTDAAMGLGEALGLVGHNVVQAFYTPESGPRFIEVNPRFGGASTLSIAAGLDSPARLMQMVRGEAAARAPRPIRHGLTLLRHAEDRFLSPGQLAALSSTAQRDG